VRRRSRAAPWLSLLLAALACPLSLGWTVYTFRAVDVACTRALDRVDCRVVERVGGVPVWSAAVEDIRIARGMTNNNSGPVGVIAETEAGALVPLTSSTLGEDQIRAIATRIHEWIFSAAPTERLEFTQPPSLPNAFIGAGIALVAALWALATLLGLVRARRRPARARGQQVTI
jgi:hypothetical protein